MPILKQEDDIFPDDLLEESTLAKLSTDNRALVVRLYDLATRKGLDAEIAIAEDSSLRAHAAEALSVAQWPAADILHSDVRELRVHAGQRRRTRHSHDDELHFCLHASCAE